MPTMHNELFDQIFNKDYYAKKMAIWGVGDFSPLLGDAGLLAPNYLQIIIFGLVVGLIIGLLVFSVLIYKRKQKQ
jgi:Flp pilus assembly protein protease CpaA